jgi:hypothetical protein
LAIYDTFCERYGLSLYEIQKKYSMAQLALLSHVAMLKQKDMEKEDSVGKKESPPGQKGKRLNRDNADAYMLIAGGILG